jgi:hypothetical protein
MSTQIIPRKIQKFINSIPENGTVEVAKNSWEGSSHKGIGKINGRLEFFELEDNGCEPAFTTCWVWHYEASPEKWEDFFDLAGMPRKTGKIFKGTFI